MRIIVWNSNPYQENTFFVSDPDGKDGAVIDPGIGSMAFVESLLAEELVPARIINTHGHIDHIAGNGEIATRLSIPIWCHELERDSLVDPMRNLSVFAPPEVRSPEPEKLLADGEVVKFAGARWVVLHTPGHSPGGLCLYCEEEKVIFTGDTLFAKSVGRTDLPGGNWDTLMNSIREKLIPLPDDVMVYSGHGPEIRLGLSKKYNPFLYDLIHSSADA
jgi:glyoxylase-like metal-dependent hydrolase (beta-lactamase superfamily II)